MRVRVAQNAGINYRHRCYRHADPQCGMLHKPEWVETLKAIEGQWVDVETKYLFSDQFNTGPIPGVSEGGLRLMVSDIDAIEGDVRLNALKCTWCGLCVLDTDWTKCPGCLKDTLFPLKPTGPVGSEAFEQRCKEAGVQR